MPQNNRINCRALLSILGTAVLALRLTGAPAAETNKPAVLFVGVPGFGGTPASIHTWDEWLAAGFQIDAREIEKVESFNSLKAFNVVVVNSLPFIEPTGQPAAAQLRFEKALDAYLHAGGGVVVFCGGGQWRRMSPAVTHLLAPYGAAVPEEQVVDPDHIAQTVAGPPGFKIALTTQIEPSPMTNDVRRIGYVSQASRADVMKLMQPIVLKDPTPWHVVVRGEKTAYTAVGKDPGNSPELKDTPATYKSSPPLAAYRDVGKGRLFVFPQNIAQTVGSPEIFEGYIWHKPGEGPADAPDNRRFIMQAIGWAAEPSLQSGALGGFRTDPNFRPGEANILKPGTSIDWAKAPAVADMRAAQLGNLRGLIGAQSTFSGGAHSVAEMCAATKSAGLDFLAFTERLDKLTPQTWDRLKQECRAQSDAHFLALPGLAARDTAGNFWFAVGAVDFPKPPAVTPDHTRISQTYTFWWGTFGTRLVGFAYAGENPNKWYEMKQLSAFAVMTTAGGKVVDDSMSDYYQSCYNMENYLPVVYTAMNTPEEVSAAAHGPVNVFGGESLKALADYVAGTGAYDQKIFWDDPSPWYVSNGPVLNYYGGIRLGSFGVDEEVENTYRYGFKLSGLKAGDRILLMDGPQIFREWRAHGDTFQTEHTWPHEQVRVFIVRVVRGNETVLLASPVTLNWARRFMQCGDRQNTIPYNYEPDEKGDWYVSGIPLGCHYKAWEPNTLVYPNYKVWEAGAVGIEYHPPLILSWFTGPAIPFNGPLQEPSPSLASYQYQRLSCPGIVIVDEITNRVYPNGGRHSGDATPPKPTEPLQLFNYQTRRYGLYGALYQENAQLVESRIEVLKDIELKGGAQDISVSYANIRPTPSQSLETNANGDLSRICFGDLKKPLRRSGSLKRGDYIGVYPYGIAHGGAQYAVDGDLQSILIAKPDSLVDQFRLHVPGDWHKGQNFSYSILYSTGGSLPQRPQSDYQSIDHLLGLEGAYPDIDQVKGGTLTDAPVIATFDMQAKQTLQFATVHDLGARLYLPVRIHGLNPNWQVCYVLDGSKHWRYMGQLDGDFYFSVNPATAAHTIRAGHPVWASRDDVIVHLDDPTGEQSAFEVYNPTDKRVDVQLTTNPAFFPAATQTVTLQPYESKRVSFRTPGA